MTKLFLSILVLFALVAILYFAFSKQVSEKLLGGTPTITPQTQLAESPTVTSMPTPTATVEDDLTALEKDLSALQVNDTELGQDLNSL